MCSTQGLPFLNPACSLRRIRSSAVDILFRITLLNTLLVMYSSVIHLQLLQRLRFNFFGSFTISPVFPSAGISSSSPTSLKISVRVSVMMSPPALSISELTLSAPDAFPDFMLYIADFNSFAVGGSMLSSRPPYSSLSRMSSTYLGASLLRMVSKCVFHSCVCLSTLVITTPSASFIGMSKFLKPPANALVILYSVAIIYYVCICAADSASSASFSMNALLSAFVFLFTSLSRIEYLVCSCSFIRCDLVSFIFFLVSFLSSIVFHVSVFIHSSFRFFSVP